MTSQLRSEDSNDAFDHEACVAAAQSGDSSAFEELVRAYQQTITTQMRRFSRDPLIIEELVHDVFVEAYVSLGSFRGRAPFVHWLRRIAVRTGYRHWKSKSQDEHATIDISSVAERVQNEPTQAGACDLLEEVLRLLKPRDRLVLTLLYWDGCSVHEVAQLLGWSRSMVRVQAHRARKRLKKLFESKMSDPHELLVKLGEMARREATPPVDVERRVMQSLAARTVVPDVAPLAIAAMATAIAVTVLIASIPVFQTMSEPWACYFPR